MEVGKVECPNCKKKIAEGNPFCPYCGNKQPQSLSKSGIEKNPYKILQVSENAELEVIEAVYKSLARKYHPDSGTSSVLEERMREINWAHEILSDQEKLAEWKMRKGRKQVARPSAKVPSSPVKITSPVTERKPKPVSTPPPKASSEEKPPSSNTHQLVNEKQLSTISKPPTPNKTDESSKQPTKTGTPVGWLLAFAGFIIFICILLVVASSGKVLTIFQPSKPTLTRIPTISFTPTHVPTRTLLPSPSPTSTPDTRVIDIDPQTMLLTKADLPGNGEQYQFFSYPMALYNIDNSFFKLKIQEQEKIEEYLERTGRVMGWIVTYNLKNTVYRSSNITSGDIVLFETHQGAMIYLEEYSPCVSPYPGYTIFETVPIIGDASLGCMWTFEVPEGEYNDYCIVFVYRNISLSISMGGYDKEELKVKLYQIAETLLSRLRSAPLSENVTFTPR